MRNNHDIETIIIGIYERINKIYYTIPCKKMR